MTNQDQCQTSCRSSTADAPRKLQYSSCNSFDSETVTESDTPAVSTSGSSIENKVTSQSNVPCHTTSHSPSTPSPSMSTLSAGHNTCHSETPLVTKQEAPGLELLTKTERSTEVYNNSDYFNYFKELVDVEDGRYRISRGELRIINSGGNGLIVLVVAKNSTLNDFLIKLSYKAAESDVLAKEYHFGLQIKNAFQKLSHFGLAHYFESIDYIEFYGMINAPIQFQGRSFSCCYLMDFKKAIINSVDLVQDREALSIAKQLGYTNGLFLASYQYELDVDFSLKTYNEPISEQNPPRYLMISVGKVETIGIDRSDYLKSMARAFAFMIWGAKLSLNDLEILIGENNGKIVYNIIDFGELEDITQEVFDFTNNGNINDVINKIDDVGSPFWAKDSFPSDPNTIDFAEFVDHFSFISRMFLNVSDQLWAEFMKEFKKLFQPVTF
ncbi:hypothetical protein P9112_000860 [Eukaryota sp. TZLM1-RC]